MTGSGQALGIKREEEFSFFLNTDDFDGDYKLFKSKGIEFTEGPFEADYGRVAVFKDLYGNRIDLIGPP